MARALEPVLLRPSLPTFVEEEVLPRAVGDQVASPGVGDLMGLGGTGLGVATVSQGHRGA